jgi:hypothetical protein
VREEPKIRVIPKILWISRHPPNKAQMAELKRIYNGEVQMVQVSATITSAQDVIDMKREHNADEVIANLPLHFYQKLTHRGINPIRSATREETYTDGEGGGTKITRTHDHFERIVSVEVVAHPLSQEARR